MNFIHTQIPEVVIIEPKVFNDPRGYFFESYRQELFDNNIKPIKFIQDNETKSSFGVLRGLHYQIQPYAQSKLIRVIKGKVLDVAVDIREGSPTFGNTVIIELSGENKKQLFVPRGFAHGYVVLEDNTIFSYKVDNLYMPSHEKGIIYNDFSLKIDWKIDPKHIVLSEKDKNLTGLDQASLFDYNEKLY